MNNPIIHVVAGVLLDAQGRILLAQRPPGKHLAGFWEFPGGKCEPGESPQMALRRELHEELGIDAQAFDRLIRIPWQYPEKSILLDIYNVISYTGMPAGREAQTLRWFSMAEIDPGLMPAADRPVIAALKLPRQYVITPEPENDSDAFLNQLQRVAESGATLIQLRAKYLAPDRLRTLALAARDRVAHLGAKLLINTDIALAQELALDGVHLPAANLMGLEHRPLPLTRWVAASCHNERELLHAMAIGVDFVTLGPVQATASHRQAPALGWQRLRELCAIAALPVYALGGLASHDLEKAKEAGAFGVAGISAFWAAR